MNIYQNLINNAPIGAWRFDDEIKPETSRGDL